MIHIKVPATSANLGAGFDCMGLAVDICNEIWAERNEKGLVIETDADLPRDRSNLVFRALSDTMKYIRDTKGNTSAGGFLAEYIENPLVIQNLTIRQKNNIPKGAGLGSSAACAVAGALLADALCGGILTEDEVVNLTAALDGHPDNVVPALVGGIAASFCKDGRVFYTKIDLSKEVHLTFFVPPFSLATQKARAVLPAKYPREDAVFNIGRAVLTFAALARGDFELLREAVGDRLHERYREPLIHNFADVVGFARDAGAVACYLSGAGSAVAAFTDERFDTDKMRHNLERLPDRWKIYRAKVLEHGAEVVK